MIYYETEQRFKKEFNQFLNDTGIYAKSTVNRYKKDAFSLLESDKGIDFWSIVINNGLLKDSISMIESYFNIRTILYGKHIMANSYSNLIPPLNKVIDFVNTNEEWKEIVESESNEFNKFIENRCSEIFSNDFTKDKIDLLIEEFREKIGNHPEEVFRNKIVSYLFVVGLFEVEDFIKNYYLNTDVMEITLKNMQNDKLPSAFDRIRKDIIEKEHSEFLRYDYRRKWLSQFAENKEIEIDMSDSIFKNETRNLTNYKTTDFWTITDKVESTKLNNIITYKNNEEDFKERVAHIPEGNHIVTIENIKINQNDDYFKYFDKGMLITGVYKVVENPGTGKTLKLKLVDDRERIYYHDTNPHNFTYSFAYDWNTKSLMQFIFENKKQDMQLYIEKYAKTKDIVEIDVSDHHGEESKYSFTDDLFMSDQEIDELTSLILKKKNIILQGAPGVGKTFSAKRLAYSIIGARDDSKVAHIQFHQSYSYEDLVMGYRPSEEGFELKTGPFYDFCKVAAEDLNNEYFFIIDEINRGNISKIFGELLMLIEADKRGPSHSIGLIYNDEPFYVPENLHIIGMMNTADRSLAMIDYAFRRRFAFYELKPAFDNNKFKSMLDKTESYKLAQLVEVLKDLNKEIINDTSLGRGFVIGHSYVTKHNIVEDTEVFSIIKYEILPLLEEYWFDDDDKFNKWSSKLMGI